MNVPTYDDFIAAGNKIPETQFRPKWDEYFMSMAILAARRSTCSRRKVGAVLVSNHSILSTGYNGAPADFDSPEAVGCFRDYLGIPSSERIELCRGIHAEQNAIILAARNGQKIDGADLYCTHKPCITCQKMLINGGIQRIVFFNNYEDTDIILKEALLKKKIILEEFRTDYLVQLDKFTREFPRPASPLS